MQSKSGIEDSAVSAYWPWKVNSATCKPVDHGLPWLDILPDGTQNLFIYLFILGGGMACSNLHQKVAASWNFHVNFSVDGALRISASGHMTYTPLPSTVDWPKVDQIEGSNEGETNMPMNKIVMVKIRQAGEIPYKATSRSCYHQPL